MEDIFHLKTITKIYDPAKERERERKRNLSDISRTELKLRLYANVDRRPDKKNAYFYDSVTVKLKKVEIKFHPFDS